MLPLLAASAVLAALGILLWALTWRSWRRRAAMRRWPTTQALVHAISMRNPHYSSQVDVEVSYRHEGRNHRVWCRSPTGSGHGGGRQWAEQRVAKRFPVRSVHPVYLNPARFDEAYLELPEAHVLALAGCGGLILLGVAASVALPALSVLDEEVSALLVMALIGVVLSVFVLFAGVAWFKAPPARRRR